MQIIMELGDSSDNNYFDDASILAASRLWSTWTKRMKFRFNYTGPSTGPSTVITPPLFRSHHKNFVTSNKFLPSSASSTMIFEYNSVIFFLRRNFFLSRFDIFSQLDQVSKKILSLLFEISKGRNSSKLYSWKFTASRCLGF